MAEILYLYCGPYVECRVGKTKTTCQRRLCANSQCELHVGGRWQPGDTCPTCGTSITEEVFVVEEDAVDPWEVEEKLDPALVQPFGRFASVLSNQGLHIWVGSETHEHTRDTVAQRHFSLREEMLAEIRPADIEQALMNFQETHAKDLDQLRIFYGPSNVTVKWGMINGSREYLTGMPMDSGLRKIVHSILHRNRDPYQRPSESTLKSSVSDTVAGSQGQEP